MTLFLQNVVRLIGHRLGAIDDASAESSLCFLRKLQKPPVECQHLPNKKCSDSKATCHANMTSFECHLFFWEEPSMDQFIEFFRGRRQLYFTFPRAPDPLFKASKAPFLTLRVSTPSGAPRQAPLDQCHSGGGGGFGEPFGKLSGPLVHIGFLCKQKERVATPSGCHRGLKPQDYYPKWLGKGAKGVSVYLDKQPVAVASPSKVAAPH